MSVKTDIQIWLWDFYSCEKQFLTRWTLMVKNFLHRNVSKSLDSKVERSINDCLADIRLKKVNYIKFRFWGQKKSVF